MKLLVPKLTHAYVIKGESNVLLVNLFHSDVDHFCFSYLGSGTVCLLTFYISCFLNLHHFHDEVILTLPVVSMILMLRSERQQAFFYLLFLNY